MQDDNPSILSHVSAGTNDFERALKFYDAVMPILGAKRVLEALEHGAVAYGKLYPEFWVQKPHDGGIAETANGTHFGFNVSSKEQVHAFWDAAIAAGASPDGEPGDRPHYGEPYYAVSCAIQMATK